MIKMASKDSRIFKQGGTSYLPRLDDYIQYELEVQRMINEGGGVFQENLSKQQGKADPDSPAAKGLRRLGREP